MIKKILLIGLISLFAIMLTNSAAYAGDSATKLGRGICNMITFPLEIPEQISRVNNSDGPFAGATVGVVKGTGMALWRACVGIFETATFMMPGPDHYKPILRDPEYFFETSNY